MLGPGARRGARRPRAGSAATATRSCRWTRRARRARSTSPAGRTAPSSGLDLPPGAIAGFEHEAAEEFFRAVASAGAADAARRAAGGHERAPHDRGVLQGVRPRAARRGLDRPRRDRRAVDQGDADVTVALVDYGMGNRRSVEKALEHVGATVARTADRDEIARRRRDRACPASARSRRRCAGCARSGSTTLIRERADAGVPVLGICLGMQLLFDVLDRARGRRGARPARRAPSTRLEAPGPEDPAHRLEHRHVRAAVAADRGARRRARPSTTCTRSPAGPRTSADVVGRGEYGERVRLDRRARQRDGRAVPPGEVLARRARAAAQLRRASESAA